MLRQRIGVLAFPLSLLLWLPLVSCSTGTQKPKQGTPAFYWQAATETLATRDYLKTTEHLRRVMRTDNEYTQRALPFRLAVASGIANAYLDLAADLEKGVAANKSNPTPVRKSLTDHRTVAETRIIEFVETMIQYGKSPKEATVVLDFAFPPAGSGEIRERGQLQAGQLPSAEVMSYIERRMVEQAVPEAIAAAAGASGDFAKARSLFQSGKASLPREVFLHAMLDSLYRFAKFFDRSQMDKPERLYLLANLGLDTLKTMEASEQNKLDTGRFQALVKAAQSK